MFHAKHRKLVVVVVSAAPVWVRHDDAPLHVAVPHIRKARHIHTQKERHVEEKS